MKKLFAIIPAILLCLSLSAQDYLYIHFKDGSSHRFVVEDIDRINFKEETPPVGPSHPESMDLNKREIWITDFTPFQLEAIYKSDFTETVVWSSSNPSVATVSDNGIVTPCGYGSTAISAAIAINETDFITAGCRLTVVKPIDSNEAALDAIRRCYNPLLGLENEWNGAGYMGDPYKASMFAGQHPTLDMQASGWDKDYNVQNYSADSFEMADAYKQAYRNIMACNLTLRLINDQKSLSEEVERQVKGEVMAMRGFCYFWLATTFGLVPIVDENSTDYNVAKAESYQEMWDFIISNFKMASELLTWDFSKSLLPYSCTKGMALSYLGDAYMWKAYLCPSEGSTCYIEAKNALAQVINSGAYELQPSYSTLWDFVDNYSSDPMTGYLNSYDRSINKESIFQIVLFEGKNWGSWADLTGAHGWTGFYWGCTGNGSWGAFALSWELYDSFEKGDRRRDASIVAAPLNRDLITKEGKRDWCQSFRLPKWEQCNSRLLGQSGTDEYSDARYDVEYPMGLNPFNQELVNAPLFKMYSADPITAVYSLKHWRNGRGTYWSAPSNLWLPDRLYLKRFANVLLDYAECCFMLAQEAEGWEAINKLRHRAFGNMEVGHADELNAVFGKYYSDLANFYGDEGHGQYVDLGGYPIPFATEFVEVPDALTYYAELKKQKGFISPVWKVAVNEERRKELNTEASLYSDMVKSGYWEDHILHNYPNEGSKYGLEYMKTWQSYRNFTPNMSKIFFPLPKDALNENPNLTQNPVYGND